MTKRKFLAMCRQHDLTYGRSDDFRYWTAGSKSYQKIMAAAEELGHDVAARIWNMVVDEKVREDSRKDWYWDV